MAQFHKLRCPVCYANLEMLPEDLATFDTCPSCKTYIKDKLNPEEQGSGLTTARASGPGLHPLGGTIQDVY